MKVSKSTIVRSIMFAVVIINLILKYLGYDAIVVEESELTELIEMLISVAILIWGWWKNNSFTQNAIKADKFLEDLKTLKESE